MSHKRHTDESQKTYGWVAKAGAAAGASGLTFAKQKSYCVMCVCVCVCVCVCEDLLCDVCVLVWIDTCLVLPRDLGAHTLSSNEEESKERATDTRRICEQMSRRWQSKASSTKCQQTFFLFSSQKGLSAGILRLGDSAQGKGQSAREKERKNRPPSTHPLPFARAMGPRVLYPDTVLVGLDSWLSPSEHNRNEHDRYSIISVQQRYTRMPDHERCVNGSHYWA